MVIIPLLFSGDYGFIELTPLGRGKLHLTRFLDHPEVQLSVSLPQESSPIFGSVFSDLPRLDSTTSILLNEYLHATPPFPSV